MRGLVAVLTGLTAGGALGLAAAQPPPPDLTQPPRLEEGDAPRPGAARLAPPAEDRPVVLEEVVVVSESEWRLPDLGSTWREEAASEPGTGRIEVAFLPIFDPEGGDPYANLFPPDNELERTGFIEIFRLRFGRRSTGGGDDD